MPTGEADALFDHGVADTARSHSHESRLSRSDYMTGIGLLLIVVFLWTSSNFITQDLFEDGYEKPFLVTYLNTSAFAIYLIPWLIKSLLAHHLNRIPAPVSHGYEVLATADTSLEAPTATIIANFRAPSIFSEDFRKPDELSPLTIRETASLASVFCLFWFIANWSVNASLGLTSVASATILSSTSGFFTLLVGRVFKVEALSLAKICAVVTSFFGVILVSFSDSMATESGSSDGLSVRSDQWSEALFGDALALLSAIFYALYVVLLKVRIKEESRIDMQLFFGFVGLFNVLMLWPLGIILHFTGAETLSFPPTRKAWIAVLINMFITLSSDYIYVLAMLKTTPLVVTIGLSLTIPLAIIGDFFLKIPTAPQAIFGAILVVGAFVVVGVENSQGGDTTQKTFPVDEAGIEVESVSDATERA